MTSLRADPSDDLHDDLLKMLTEIVEQLPGLGHARVISWTLIPHARPPPRRGIALPDDDRFRLRYETIATRERVYITARVPFIPAHPPHVEIHEGSVHIHLDGRAAVIPLESRADPASSGFTFRHGVLDIVVVKRDR